MRLITLILAFLIAGNAHASRTSGEPTEYFNQLVSVIYIIEGADKTPHPYGIVSIKVRGSGSEKASRARQICYNTVRNNYYRWIASGSKRDFISWLARIYCPVGAENDKGLNYQWPSNVRKYMVRLYGTDRPT